MDDLGFNKIAAAVLATALGYMGLKEISHALMHTEAPDVPVYALEIVDTSDGSEPEIELPFPTPEFVAAMDAARGEKVFKKCLSCHNVEQGGANGTGPNLWNIVGQPVAQKAGFNYSSAMSSANLSWDYETLNDYLTKPTAYIKGTAMNFIGLKKEDDRAAVIEYLRVNAPSPVPQPEPAEQPTEEVAEVVDDVTVPADEESRVVDVPIEEDLPEQPTEVTSTEDTPAEETPDEQPEE